MPPTPESLQKFVQYCQQHLKGDEKGESQTFLDRFFQAFGHEGAIEAGATLEERVKKGSKKGNTGFADLAWKPHLLIEMKKRGEDLNKHYAQAVSYWHKLNCPSYMMLCNFDEFWIYDFRKQSEEPIEKVPLARLVDRTGAFTFMNPELERSPIFNNNLVSVTEKAAGRMGELLTLLTHRSRDAVDPKTAQRFVLQCVLAMFAEDRKLLPDDLFIGIVRECLERSRQGKPSNTYDLLGTLFQEMNRPGITPAGRYRGVDYFNGGLFKEVQPLELTQKELELLEAAASQDWKAVRPSIFGNIFESAIGKSNSKERHAHGIHFTSEEDILKIVRPTITRYWEAKIEQATTLAELYSLRMELQDYRVLDPACGSGNFLYMAYLELKRLERVLQDKIDADPKSKSGQGQLSIGFVTPQQFYGMDTNAFAVELARVTLMIARKVAIDLCDIHDQPALPLDTLDENIVCKDALFTEWVKADAIIGNPPFLGGKHMRMNLSDEYIDRVFSRFPDVKDSVDFCAYWFRLAHDQIDENGRVGLVGTNSISQGKSRIAALDYVVQNGGVIHDAVSTQVWSGEANVHVSIVNWVKEPSPLAPEPSPLAPLPDGEGNKKEEEDKTIRLPSPLGRRVGDEGLSKLSSPLGRRAGDEGLSKLPSPLGRRVGDEGDWDDDISKVAGRTRQIPRALLERAQELRQKQTPAEQILWECLRDRHFLDAKFRRQHNLSQYIADFYCHKARLVIELDGGIHESRQVEDADRDQWMQANGFTVLRFRNDEVIDDIAQVLGAIAVVLEPSPLAPLPDGEGNKKEEGNKTIRRPSPLGRRAGDEGLSRLPSPLGRRVGDEGKSTNTPQTMLCYLDNQPVAFINSSLKSTVDVSQATRLKANLNKCFQGVIPVGKGFVVTEEQVNDWIKADSKNQEVLKLFSMGANLAQEVNGKPERWIIDFSNMSVEDAGDYKLLFEHVKLNVKPEREQNREAVMREKWWRFKRTNEAMRKALASLDYCFAIPRVSKWAIFIPFPFNWLAGDKSVVVASDDFYVFGILTSNVHRTWMHAQKSTLKADIAYTHNTCFETFPFPQTPDPNLITAIRATAQELHDYRSQQMERKQWGITKLYNEYFHEPSSQLFKLHAKLDALVLQAYGFNPNDDLLEKLLALNLELAEKEKNGDAIVGAWAPQ